MKKTLIKKILTVLDAVESHGVIPEELPALLLDALAQSELPYTEAEVRALVPYLFRRGFLKDTGRGIDLSPSATILAKADADSKPEALALFACYCQSDDDRRSWRTLMSDGMDEGQLIAGFDPLCVSLLSQSTLLNIHDHHYTVRGEYAKDMAFILREYEENENLLLAVTLCACYAQSMIAQTNDIVYKNTDQAMIDYPYRKHILNLLPRKGVPAERSETKAVQSFYKDTLFHECDHACVLCGIDIAQMLIASHIKPFRDCAHIYEAIDHNNGLLLCRNHDFLFDQGYISFAEDGAIMISKDLKVHRAYHIVDTIYLPSALLSKERRLFLCHHRNHIFRG